MFGNATGWIISAVIAVVAGFLGNALLEMVQPTAPTGWVQRTVLPLTVPDLVKAGGIVDPMTDLKDDAAELVRNAITDYHNHKTAYTELQKTLDFDEAEVASLTGLSDLVTAAGCPTMELFKTKPEIVVGFSSSVPEIDDLNEIVATVGHVIALAKYEKNYDLAHKYANAIAVLGYHLYTERAAYVELSAGTSYLGTGVAAMKSIAQALKETSKETALNTFDLARQAEYSDRIEPAIKVISGQGQSNIGEHAGDMFLLAGDSKYDHVWRVEAIRKVGRLQFNSETMPDQKKAPRFLAKLAADTKEDALIHAAAVAARDMTAADNQAQR